MVGLVGEKDIKLHKNPRGQFKGEYQNFRTRNSCINHSLHSLPEKVVEIRFSARLPEYK